MNYVPVPIDLLEIGKTIPVDLWDRSGKLLLRRGHSLQSEQHREMLAAHEASMTEGDALAWTRGYERMLHAMLRDGSSAEAISRLTMPGEIPEADFLDEAPDDMPDGWLGLRDRLQGMLYQPQSGADGLGRLDALRHKALDLLQREPDECLFVLFQALADPALGYCASHALLSAVVCELTAHKVGMSARQRTALFRAALMMNIGMARAQDALATQNAMPSDAQRNLIRDHPRLGAEMLQAMGLEDGDAVDIVRWHHDPDAAPASSDTLQPCHLLRVADMFVAKMAARKTRLAMSPLGAARSMVLNASGVATVLASAVATAVGFYPPGTYVQLVNGERAVVVRRGPRAHDAQVVSIVSPGGMPLLQYLHRDVRESRYAIRAPINAEKIRVLVSFERAYAALAQGRA
jgi:HD-GYP domain-containing protein (c-di-GMP phosphodiesterase class II)